MFASGTGANGSSSAVLPIVSLNAQLLEKAADGTYNVKWEKGDGSLFPVLGKRDTFNEKDRVYHMS